MMKQCLKTGDGSPWKVVSVQDVPTIHDICRMKGS